MAGLPIAESVGTGGDTPLTPLSAVTWRMGERHTGCVGVGVRVGDIVAVPVTDDVVLLVAESECVFVALFVMLKEAVDDNEAVNENEAVDDEEAVDDNEAVDVVVGDTIEAVHVTVGEEDGVVLGGPSHVKTTSPGLAGVPWPET